jgi:hypothetical protein
MQSSPVCPWLDNRNGNVFCNGRGNIAEQSQKLETLLKELPDSLYCYALVDDGFDYKRRKIWQSKASWPLYDQPDWGSYARFHHDLLHCILAISQSCNSCCVIARDGPC